MILDWPAERVEKLRELHAQTPQLSYQEIGRRLGCSKNSIAGKVLRLGLQQRPSPIRPLGTPRKPQPKRAKGVTLPALADAPKPLPEALIAALDVKRPVIAPTIRSARAPRPCLYTSGQRGAWVCCEAMSEVGSLWCSAHRARCSKPNTKNDAGEFQPGRVS